MLKDPKLRREIYVGVIAAVLVLLVIEPLLRLAANLVLWAGANVYEGITNTVYKSAALGFREKFSFVTLTIIFASLVGTSSGFASALFRRDRPPLSEQKLARTKYLAIALSILLFLQVFYLAGLYFAELQLNASFNQRLTVLASKLNDQQIKELRARWALMERRSDYVSLNSEMESLASKSSIKLPKLLWE